MHFEYTVCVCVLDGFLSPPVVIPPAVPKTSVRLKGNHTFFQIVWDGSNIDFGSVFYCVVSEEMPQNAEQLQNVPKIKAL